MGTKVRQTPKAVATPLPPLNPRKGVYTCPRIEIAPAASGRYNGSGTKFTLTNDGRYKLTKRTGRTPFRASKTRTMNPYFQPITLPTLVAPIFLLPC